MELRDAIISENQRQSHPDDMPTEQFKINFTKILWTLTLPDVDVSRSCSLRSGWSIVHNRPIDNIT